MHVCMYACTYVCISCEFTHCVGYFGYCVTFVQISCFLMER